MQAVVKSELQTSAGTAALDGCRVDNTDSRQGNSLSTSYSPAKRTSPDCLVSHLSDSPVQRLLAGPALHVPDIVLT